MAKDVRERMVAGATQLLASRGLQATSFSEVIELTDTPRGSIYHHFPGGKDELVLAALDRSCGVMLTALDDTEGASPETVLQTVVDGWRALLVGREFTTGCAVVAVTVATGSDELRSASAEVFDKWQDRLTGRFTDGGMEPAKAATFAALALSTIEGAVVIARAKRSIDAYDRAVALLPQVLESMK